MLDFPILREKLVTKTSGASAVVTIKSDLHRPLVNGNVGDGLKDKYVETLSLFSVSEPVPRPLLLDPINES